MARDGNCDRVLARAKTALAGTLRDPASSRSAAQSALRDSRGCPPTVAAWSLLALGDANLKLFRIDAAAGALERALALDDGTLPRPLVLRIRLTLASARMLHGDSPGAWALVEQAESELDADAVAGTGVFEPLDAGALRDRRARLLIEAERPEEALTDLDFAVAAFEAAGRDEATLIARNNRGLVQLQLRRYTAARADLERVETLAADTRLALVAAAAAENLGYLAALLGDYPEAVEAFGRAERALAECGIEPGQLWVDKAKLLLSLHEFAEAEQAARRAASLLRAQRKWMLYPTAHLLLADIALLSGDHETAITSAQTAARAFRRVDRRPSAALARLTLLRARHAAGIAVAPGRARTVARTLEEAGHVTAGVEARILAAQLALGAGRVDTARVDLEHAAAAGRDGPAHARAQGWLAEAMLRRSRGRRRQAYLALSAGLQVLAQHRASVGSSEVRARVGLNRAALAGLGLTMALEEGEPAIVHLWAEHARATAGLERPGRTPDDDRLAELLDRLRTTTARLESADVDAGPEPGAALVDVRAETVRQAGLEREIREHVRRTQGDQNAAYPPVGLRAVQEQLGDLAMVEFIEHDGRLHALSTTAQGVQLRDLGEVAAITAALRYTSFALDRLARRAAGTQARDAAVAVLRRSGGQLQRSLFDPVAAQLGDRELVIVAPPLLHAFPWALVPACRGRPVSVTSSASLWVLAARRRPHSQRVLVTAGPGLPEAVREAREIEQVYSRLTVTGDAGDAGDAVDARVLLPPHSTAEAVAQAMRGARVAHFAAHGDLRRGNPSFSAVWLTDGPFMVHDIERLDGTPHHVVLAACDTARSHVLAGREVLGLTTALLGQDTSAIVAPTVTIPDAQTRPLMLAYHRRLAAGESPAGALAQAQVEVFTDSRDDGAIAAAAAFVCLGAGHEPVFSPSSRVS